MTPFDRAQNYHITKARPIVPDGYTGDLAVGWKITHTDGTTGRDHDGRPPYFWGLVGPHQPPVLHTADRWDDTNTRSCPNRPGDGLCVATHIQHVTSGGVRLASCIGHVLVYPADLARSDEDKKLRVPWVVHVESFDALHLIRLGLTADLYDADLSGADLRYANLGGADLHGADLHGADLRYANLRDANLHGADLHDADLHDADLHGANLHGANLRYADLHGANLRYANLRYANLRYADLHDADLHGANLHGADLRDANLRYANLRYANLRDANLHGADLHGANLRYANLRDANLHGAKADRCTWPEGFDPAAAGVTVR